MTDRLTDEQVAVYANAIAIYPSSLDETSLTSTINALAREVQEWRAQAIRREENE